MVSVSILSFGLLLVLNSFIKPMRATEFSRNYFKAGLLFEYKMLEILSTDVPDGFSEGGFDDFGGKFSWNLEVLRSEENSCREINLKIFWAVNNKEEDLSASTYI